MNLATCRFLTCCNVASLIAIRGRAAATATPIRSTKSPPLWARQHTKRHVSGTCENCLPHHTVNTSTRTLHRIRIAANKWANTTTDTAGRSHRRAGASSSRKRGSAKIRQASRHPRPPQTLPLPWRTRTAMSSHRFRENRFETPRGEDADRQRDDEASQGFGR